MKLMGWNSKDIGVDLGTANIIITIKGKGIVLNEPSVVAIDKNNGTILATGAEAKEMLGRTPNDIAAIRPLKDGVIADFTATQLMLKSMLQRVCQRYNAGRPRVVVGVPSGITEVEERAVEESVMQAGAREVYIIEEPNGNIIVDIGGGTTEVAVVSLGGIVTSNSLRVAGDELNEDIVNYVKREMNLAIGETTAEQVKINIGCAKPLLTEETAIITSTQVQEAMSDSIEKIVDIIKQTLEKTPPELASDIMERGIVLTGGGALIRNFDSLLAEKTEMPVYVADHPLECVAKGAEKTLEDLEKLRTVLSSSRRR